MQAYHVSLVFPEGRDQEQARACPGFHHRPIKVEGATLGLNLHRGLLRVRPLSDKIHKDLGLDLLAWHARERFSHELY
jgi:hypothetical protein